MELLPLKTDFIFNLSGEHFVTEVHIYFHIWNEYKIIDFIQFPCQENNILPLRRASVQIFDTKPIFAKKRQMPFLRKSSKTLPILKRTYEAEESSQI
jgi:S-adenosylmethionine/arginine decarboxylase-like enzyme